MASDTGPDWQHRQHRPRPSVLQTDFGPICARASRWRVPPICVHELLGGVCRQSVHELLGGVCDQCARASRWRVKTFGFVQ